MPHACENASHAPVSEEAAGLELALNEERFWDLYHTQEEETLAEEEAKRALTKTAEFGFSYDAEYDPEEPTDDQVVRPEETEVFICPDDLVSLLAPNTPLPQFRRQHASIQKTAVFIARAGEQMEIKIKVDQRHNPVFSFLNYEHELNSYYKQLVRLIKAHRFTPIALNVEFGPREAPPRPTIHADTVNAAPAHYLHPLLASVPPPLAAPAPQVDISGTMFGQLIARFKANEELQKEKVREAAATEQAAAGTPPAAASADSGVVSTGRIVPPPPDLKAYIDKLAEYSARNGRAFEEKILARNDERFHFLRADNVYFPYYEQKKNILAKKWNDKVQEKVSFSVREKPTKEPLVGPSVEPKLGPMTGLQALDYSSTESSEDEEEEAIMSAAPEIVSTVGNGLEEEEDEESDDALEKQAEVERQERADKPTKMATDVPNYNVEPPPMTAEERARQNKIFSACRQLRLKKKDEERKKDAERDMRKAERARAKEERREKKRNRSRERAVKEAERLLIAKRDRKEKDKDKKKRKKRRSSSRKDDDGESATTSDQQKAGVQYHQGTEVQEELVPMGPEIPASNGLSSPSVASPLRPTSTAGPLSHTATASPLQPGYTASPLHPNSMASPYLYTTVSSPLLYNTASPRPEMSASPYLPDTEQTIVQDGTDDVDEELGSPPPKVGRVDSPTQMLEAAEEESEIKKLETWRERLESELAEAAAEVEEEEEEELSDTEIEKKYGLAEEDVGSDSSSTLLWDPAKHDPLSALDHRALSRLKELRRKEQEGSPSNTPPRTTRLAPLPLSSLMSDLPQVSHTPPLPLAPNSAITSMTSNMKRNLLGKLFQK